MIYDTTIASLVETLRLLATATDSKDKGAEFYREMIDFMDNLDLTSKDI